jgi:cytochrome P450
MEPVTYPGPTPPGLDEDPLERELRAHPLARVRMPHGGEAWLATRHADVRLVLGDPRFSRAAAVGRDTPRVTERGSDDPSAILSMDPPEHTRLRKLVSKTFTVRRVQDLRPRTEEIVGELLDAMASSGPPVDLVEAFALPLPVRVICELLGVPYGDWDRFHGWSSDLTAAGLPLERVLASYTSLREYVSELAARRRLEPTDDLLGGLVLASDEGDSLSEQELVSFAVTLLLAGHESTATQLADSVYVLASTPGRLAQLRDHPELLPGAVEELLRYVPLVASGFGFARIALEDVEVGGVTVPAGDPVVVSMPSANRDESVFERPGELDFGRDENPHLAFGHGVHFCLGAQLARLELQVALGMLLERFPALRLAVPPDDVPWKASHATRGPRQLPVTW